jgi:hypothetical protein
MVEVHRRGLEGGINLVRGLREEIRDIDFQIGELKTLKAEFRTKISIVHAMIPTQRNRFDRSPDNDSPRSLYIENSPKNVSMSYVVSEGQSQPMLDDVRKDTYDQTIRDSHPMASHEITEHSDQGLDVHNGHYQDMSATRRSIASSETSIKRIDFRSREKPQTASEKIAAGQSSAVAVIRPGNRGFFTVDLWQVLLRIMGFDRAAYQRGLQVASTQPNVMIV